MNNLQHEGKGDSVEGKSRGGGQKGLKKKKGCPPPLPICPFKVFSDLFEWRNY